MCSPHVLRSQRTHQLGGRHEDSPFATLGVLVGLLVKPSKAVASPGVVPDPTDGVNGEVYASVQVGDRTFIGGTFSWAGFSPPPPCRLTPPPASASASPRSEDWCGSPFPMVREGWFVGGDFVYAGGKVRNGAARVNAKGFVTRWNPTPSGSVHSLAVANGVVYHGGSFSQMGGQARSHIAAFDATSGALLSWNPGANGSVSSLA